MALTKQQVTYLRGVSRCKDVKRRRALILHGGAGLQKTLTQIAHKVLKGEVPLTTKQKTQLRRRRADVREVGRQKTSLKRRVRIQQKGGFLGALLAPLIASIATNALGLFKR